LQNALAASKGADEGLHVSIKHTPEEGLVFQYDGAGFSNHNVAHLIRSGTTKARDPETTGHFGSGFITTHLLSPKIYVSGQIDHPEEVNHGECFEFCLERKFDSSHEELESLMNKASEEFQESLKKPQQGETPLTRFQYPPIEDDASEADKADEVIKTGIAELKKGASFLVAFNKGFSQIDFELKGETASFTATNRKPLDSGSGMPKITVVTVSEQVNEKFEEKYLFLAEDDTTSTSVAVPAQHINGTWKCLDVEDTPRLFRDFPLVGTGTFSFPAVINSQQFTPVETRDGVQFNAEDANREHWKVFKAACELLTGLIKYAVSDGWSNAHTLADIPNIVSRDWIDADMLRENLNKQFIEEVSRSSVVALENCDHPASPEESTLPFSHAGDDDHNKNNVKVLWGLLDNMRDKREKLPKKAEAFGWFRAIKSWGNVSDQHSNIGFDCQKLAEEIHNAHENGNTGKGETLDVVLQLEQDITPINWLNRFHALINQEGLGGEMGNYRIVPAQDGQLHTLSKLHRDAGVAEELKNIAELLEWPIRGELRDGKIDSLDEEPGSGEWDNAHVVGNLIDKLRTRKEKNPDGKFADASVEVFKWIANQNDWSLLSDFPAFAEKDHADDPKKVIMIQRLQRDAGEYPYLAPIRSWQNGLQNYADLFPKRHILADAFFKAVPDSDVWQRLNREGLAKNCVIIKTPKKDLKPISDGEGDGEHPSATDITVTDIAFLQKKSIGIMDRIRNNQRLARLFWRFLVDWLLEHEPDGLEPKPAKCARCDGDHRYPLADWLEPVKENKWVPVGNRQERANADSLGNLLRGEPEADSLNSERAVALLREIGVRDLDTLRFTSANPREQKIVLGWLDKAKNNEKLRDCMEKVMGAAQKAQENQNLGKQVEGLVKKSIESAGFAVRNTGVGSDFEIAAEIGDLATLELTPPGENQTWLVEVKATRGHDGVRMTLKQAEEARKNKENYFLCVVPLEGGEPEKDTVREKMRFVQNIGVRVAELCKDFDDLDQWRKEITAEESQGFQLTISSGVERILVKNSVWEKEGFSLAELAKKLKS